MRFKNIEGEKFNRWTVLSYEGSNSNGCANWLCRCDCGTSKIVRGSKLLAGKSKSCGCYAREVAKAQETKHNMSRTTIYKLWVSMKARCENIKSKHYLSYGGRGITVSDQWQKFENFYADMGARPSGMCLERIDNDKGYSADNCIWATSLEQGRNKRNNVKFIVHGVEYITSELSRKFNVSITTINARLRRGWTIVDAVTRPPSLLHCRK